MQASCLHVRSYGPDLGADRHDYAQLVLPLGGTVLLDIEGRQDRLDLLRGACVAPGAWHAQRADGPNESLILDVDRGAMSHPAWERLLAVGCLFVVWFSSPRADTNTSNGVDESFIGQLLHRNISAGCYSPAR